MPKNNISPPSSVIFGCSGPSLLDEEREFYAKVNPLGFILFARNIIDPEQTHSLVADLRAVVCRPDAPVLIDQEGGRVRRLRPPHWWKGPSASVIGELYQRDPNLGLKAAYLNAQLTAYELYELGIDVNCTPVLDLALPGITEAVACRSFGVDPHAVAALGRAVCEGTLAGGVMPVIKHIPGHGRAVVDSHLHLPIVDVALDTLRQSDFLPFQSLRDVVWGITAHIVFEAVDRHNPATLSTAVIRDVIRGEIGFDGFLMTDDISMHAISGGYEERTQRALAAGCDAVLHCNGIMSEMQAVAAESKPLNPESMRRLSRALAVRKTPEKFDIAQAEAHLKAWLGGE